MLENNFEISQIIDIYRLICLIGFDTSLSEKQTRRAKTLGLNSVTVSRMFSEHATLNMCKVNVGAGSETVARIDLPRVYVTRYPVNTSHNSPIEVQWRPPSPTLTQHCAFTGLLLHACLLKKLEGSQFLVNKKLEMYPLQQQSHKS